ncbi:MAG: TPM domain-containing protein [Oscillospiraceae bacterium]|nr:TPM domain-containing protein [Oscillospiraceae bacterium]
MKNENETKRNTLKTASGRLLLFSLAAVLLLILGTLNAAAAETRVVDDAGLLSTGEIEKLEGRIASLRQAYPGMDFVFVTTGDAQGKGTQAYADDYFDENGYGAGGDDSGILFLIDMDNRNLGISTHADGIRYFTDERIESLLDDAYEFISDGDYYGTANAFLDGAKRYMEAGIPGNQYNYDTETGRTDRYKSLTVLEIAVSLLIAAAVGAVCCIIVLVRYRGKAGKNSYPFREKSEMRLTRSEDIFLRQTVTTRRISTSSSGGGGSGRSSTHTSSSGRTHGGGTRRF